MTKNIDTIIDTYSERYEEQLKSHFPNGFFDTLKNGYIPTEKKRKEFEEKKRAIKDLQDLYSKLVLQLNRGSKASGFKNYIYCSTAEDGIPAQDLHYTYSEHGQNIFKRFKDKLNLPTLPGYDYSSELGATSLEPIINSMTEKEFSLQGVVDILIDKLTEKTEYKNRINFVLNKDYMHMSTFDLESKTATVHISNTFNEMPETLHLIDAYIISHEIGHCIHYLLHMDRGDDIYDLSRYEREKFAVGAQNEFSKTLGKDLSMLVHAQQVYEYTSGFFEFQVYSEPSQDFAGLYADVFNRFWWHSRQESNPFYVADASLFIAPGISLMYPVLHIRFIDKLL